MKVHFQPTGVMQLYTRLSIVLHIDGNISNAGTSKSLPLKSPSALYHQLNQNLTPSKLNMVISITHLESIFYSILQQGEVS